MMGPWELLLLVGLIVVGILGAFGAYISAQKGRSSIEGFLFGVFLGPIGLLIAVLLPSQTRANRSGSTLTSSTAPRIQVDPTDIAGRQPPPIPGEEPVIRFRRVDG